MDELLSSPIPTADAAAFFILVKRAAAPPPPDVGALDEFWLMSRAEQGELLKEAGVTSEEFGALLKFAEKEGDLTALLAAEEQGAAAQQVNEAEFYKQRAQQAQEALAAQQEQRAQQEQQMQALQQQVDGNAAQMQQALQQAQLTQQAALTNVQAAHAAATQATQQALQATDEALKHQQLAAQMRMEYQGLRGQVMDVVSQDPAAGIGAQLSGAGMETPPPAQEPTTGPAGTSPSAGAPADAAPADPNTGAAPTASPQQSMEAQPATQAGVSKEGSAAARIPYAIGGGLLGGLAGGLGTALEARHGHEDLRAKVQQLESSPGGFRQAIDLAKAKSQLAAGEITERHPTGAVLTGALIGAGLGATAGPEIAEQGKKLYGRLAGRQ